MTDGLTDRQKAGKKYMYEQGRIHGYPSRVRMGRGRNQGHHIIWAGAMRPKTIKKKQKKVKCDGRTDKTTDGPTKWDVESRST